MILAIWVAIIILAIFVAILWFATNPICKLFGHEWTSKEGVKAGDKVFNICKRCGLSSHHFQEGDF